MGINNVIEFYKITVFIFFVTILEVVGIGLIIPFLSFISNPEKFISNANKYLTNFDFYDTSFFFQTLSNTEVTFIILGLIFAIFAIKFLYLLFVAWRVSKFLLSLQKDLSDRLLKKYLSLTYIFHLNHNASVLASSVVKESSVFSNTVINSFMVLLADGFLILAFIILVILFDPFLSSILILFSSIVVFSYYFFIKKMVTDWGEKRQFHDGLKLKHLFQSLNNVKFIIFSNLQKFFLEKFSLHNKISSNMDRNTFFLSKLPLIGLEFLSVIIFVLIIITIFSSGKNFEELIQYIGLYAAVAFRIIPSVNRCLNSLTGLRFGIPVINLIDHELNRKDYTFLDNNKSKVEIKDELCADLNFKNVFALKNISFSYNNNTLILDGINLEIQKNDFIGIVGESGSGKTTLIDVILGLLVPVNGSYLLDGIALDSRNLKSWQKKLAYIPQEPYLLDDTLKKNIAFGFPEENISESKILYCLRNAELTEFENKLEMIIGERGVRLSGGQKQRISIARALYLDPEIFVMDEPTSSLDVETEARIIDSINSISKKKTIVLVSHRESVLKKCNKKFLLRNGKLLLLKLNENS